MFMKTKFLALSSNLETKFLTLSSNLDGIVCLEDGDQLVTGFPNQRRWFDLIDQFLET